MRIVNLDRSAEASMNRGCDAGGVNPLKLDFHADRAGAAASDQIASNFIHIRYMAPLTGGTTLAAGWA